MTTAAALVTVAGLTAGCGRSEPAPPAQIKITPTDSGEMSPEEGALVVGLLEAHRKAIETSELAGRVAALEERLAQSR